jgi:formamidopyrimidine-DNA glycosylase
MPELPEVETVVRDLNKKIIGREIAGVWFDWPKLIKDYASQSRLHVSEKAVNAFSSDLIGEKVLEAKRRAKNILIYLTGNKVMLIHQKMTGHLLFGKWAVKGHHVMPIEPRAMIEDSYNRFIHLILTFKDGEMLALSDVRKFAKVILGTKEQIENLAELRQLGPDALDPKLSIGQFVGIVLSERRPIKQVLMDPKVIAGIGNIYSDDLLWRAKVHPERKANQLKPKEIKAIYLAMRSVLKKAVKLRGTSTSDFRDTSGLEGGYTEHLLVYGQKGKPCKKCKTLISRIVVGGRSAHFCPQCQKFSTGRGPS